MKRYPREESEKISEKMLSFSGFWKVSFSMKKASVLLLGYVPEENTHARLLAAVWEKKQRFSHPKWCSFKGITHASQKYDWWNERCMLCRTLLFPFSTAFVHSRCTIFARCYLSYVKLISANLFIAYRINKLRFNVAQYRKRQSPVGFDRRLSEFLLDCYDERFLRYSSTFWYWMPSTTWLSPR